MEKCSAKPHGQLAVRVEIFPATLNRGSIITVFRDLYLGQFDFIGRENPPLRRTRACTVPSVAALPEGP